ncbi:hypothetical protein UFOVP577_3 [uncultured Caudovirales phage]|uniref:Uncharacterized protein n=1 Tax=uncultured Caudovirales phage TaxID=2100421 RepID=A0A6J5MX49_9CAUD|nr:hypothetical protein UFOVP577_3 [uncultured Caudovirales phage]
MKYAYISTQEQIYSYDGTLLGARVVQVQDTKDGLVDVIPDLFWADCDDITTPDNSYYDMADQQVKLRPIKPIE